MKTPYQKGYSSAVEDYLRAIYQLAEVQGGDDQRITTSNIALRLDLRPASVTAMLQKMATAHPALVDYHKSFGVRLTPEGQQVALGVVRCHRLLEAYLHDKLGFGWDEVHDEADRLEHAISADMADRLAAALGNPTHDPHGHAIPDADLVLEQSPVIPLANLPPGEVTIVEHVQDDNAGLLRDLDAAGLHPGRAVVVIEASSPENLWIIVDDSREPHRLDAQVAAAVYVRRTNN